MKREELTVYTTQIHEHKEHLSTREAENKPTRERRSSSVAIVPYKGTSSISWQPKIKYIWLAQNMSILSGDK